MALDAPTSERSQLLANQWRTYFQNAQERERFENLSPQDQERFLQQQHQRETQAKLLTYLRALADAEASRARSESERQEIIRRRTEQAQRIVQNQAMLRFKREQDARARAREQVMRRAQGIRNVLKTDGGSVPQKDNSLLARAGRLAGSAYNAVKRTPGIGAVARGAEDVLRIADEVGSELQDVYYGAKNAQLQGGSFTSQVTAGVLQLPGAGLVPDNWLTDSGRALRRVGDQVNTREEREAARQEGRFASAGEFITGQAEDVLTDDALQNYLNRTNSQFNLPDGSARHVASALTDATFTIAVDPLSYVPGVLFRAGLTRPTLRAGERVLGGLDNVDDATRAALRETYVSSYLSNTRVGRALDRAVREAAETASDGPDLARRLPGLSQQAAARAAGASTTDEAASILRRALEQGEYIPDISLRRQALAAATGRGLRAPGGVGLGRRVVRESEGLFNSVAYARNLANRAPGRIAVTRASTIAATRRAATKASLRMVGVRSGDARNMVLGTRTGMNAWDRINDLLVQVDELPASVAEVVEATLEGLVPKAATPSAFSAKMAGLDADQKSMDALLEVETLVATARGDFGDEAAQQLRVELGVGFDRAQKADAQQVLRRAANRNGLMLKQSKVRSVTDKRLKDAEKALQGVDNAVLKSELASSLRGVKGLKGAKATRRFNYVLDSINLALDPDVGADAAGMLTRYGDMLAERATLVGGARRMGLGQKLRAPVRGVGKVVTSLTETIAPHQVRFLSTENADLAIAGRVQAIDSWLGAVGVDDRLRVAVRQGAVEVQAERDLYKLIDNAIVAHADAQGVPAEILSALLKKTQDNARKMGFASTDTGELLDEVQNLSQLNEVVALPDPADIKRTVRELKKAQDDPAKLAKIREALGDPSDWNRVSRTLSFIHRNWKLMVVTNLYMPVVGGFVGFVGEDGSFTERLKSGFQWAALGSLAPARYVIRIGIEERARQILFDRSMSVTDFIPGVARWRAERGVDLPLVSAHLLKNGDPTGSWIRWELADRPTGEFEALALPESDSLTGHVLVKLGRKDARYVDSWQRIVNYEINDANGALDRFLLARRAGHITDTEFDNWLKVWLKTDEAKLWKRRWKGAYKAPKTVDEMIDRQWSFIEKYVPEDIARTRLPALDADFQKVPPSMLKAKVKDGTAPAFIHAERTWTIPRRKTFFQDLGKVRQQLTDKFIFGGPTRAMHRNPMARKLYKEEYTALVRAGVEPKVAQRMADSHAINTTNTVMFNQHNESRFAQKVDIIFPFQQPREELIRVWAPLILNNKVRAIQMTALGARALEAGASSGVFYEYTNPYTGEKEWRAKIPGSGSLSRVLGGVNADFDFGLRDVLFLTQDNMAATFGVPSPGGPFWTVTTRALIDAFPEHYSAMPDALKDYLFPFGQSGRLGRNEPNRLWQAFMGTPAPWEFANEWEQKEEYRKVRLNMLLHLYYDNIQKGVPRTEAWPTEEQVDEATRAFLQTQSLIGAVWPAPSRYIQPWEELVNKATEKYTDANGEFDYYGFIEDFPQYAPFISSRKKFTGPDTFQNWSRDEKAQAEDYIKHWEETVSTREFRQEMKRHDLTSQAWKERNELEFMYPDYMLPDKYMEWEEKWLQKAPEVVTGSRTNYFRDRDLNRIMHMEEGEVKEKAIDRWRQRYDIKTRRSYNFHVERLQREGWKVDYWRYSRPTDTVVGEVAREARRQGINPEVIVAQLNPAEQIKWWKAKQEQLIYFDGDQDPGEIVDTYKLIQDRIGDVYKAHPKLSGGGSDPSPIEKFIEGWRGNTREQLNAVYREIYDVVEPRYQELKKQGKEWSQEGQALYAKRKNLHDLAKYLKNKQFQELPGILEFMDDVYAITAFMKPGRLNKKGLSAFMTLITNPLGYGGFLPSNEELSVLNMPPEVRQAYTEDLAKALDLPAVKGTKGKLYWEWLTDFQKDYLQRNVPADKVQEWVKVTADSAADAVPLEEKSRDIELSWAYEMFRQYSKRPKGAKPPAAYDAYLKIAGNGKEARKAFLAQHPEVQDWLDSGPMANMPPHIRQAVRNIMIKHGKWEGEIDNEFNYGFGSNYNPELGWAYEMFKQYSQRPEGAEAPAAYEEYLALPANPAVRNQFLDRHPEVAAWIAAGPMANMPAHIRYMVQNIMIKFGKWEGTETPESEIADMAFASEQLQRWNLRGDMERPGTYDIWLAMPSGVEKANYLKAHPEIGEWLRLGPMSNMPDAYQDVVRDIMTRYGKWTSEGDGLGKVISDYYATPAYAREQYLEDHPELVAYWSAIRTPEEARMSEMVNQYFSIQDPTSRSVYMLIHPELKDHFVQSRQRRYERFLTHVAVYMGQHPDMFDAYLDRQEDILNDLLLRYAEPPLLREVAPLRDATVSQRQRRRGG